MHIIVQFQGGKGSGVESDGVDFIIGGVDGKDHTKSVVGGIGLDNNRCVYVSPATDL